MNTRSILFATVLAVVAMAAFAQESSRFTPRVLEGILTVPKSEPKDIYLARLSAEIAQVEQAILDNGCDTNLCFALQGGTGISDEEFLEQQNFVDLVIQIVTTDAPANYAAVQYASRPYPISELDSRRNRFLRLLHNTSRASGGTHIASSIRWCGKQMRPREGDLNKMVLLGNGFATVGRDQVQAAKRFLLEGGHVCAITVGPSDEDALNEITQTRTRILEIDQWFELSEIIVDLVRQVCGLQ